MLRHRERTEIKRQPKLTARPLFGGGMLVIAALSMPVLLIPACQKRQPATEPATSSPATPGLQAPSNQPGEPGQKPSAGSTNASAEKTGTRPRGIDNQDDPDAPRALPKTSELRGWWKSEPIRVVSAEQLDRFIQDASRRSILKTFRVRRVSRCTYRSEGSTARVLLIEAQNSVDAFGIFSVLNPQPGETRGLDGSMRASRTSSTGPVLSAWQGEVYVEVEFAGCDRSSEGGPECEQLFDGIVFNLPKADPPLLLQAVPPDRRKECKVWVVRSAAALAGADNKVLRTIAPTAMDQRLGLTGDTILSVAAVPVADDESPNLIWMAEYRNAEGATDAYKRCQEAVRSPANRLDRNTIVDQPRGVFLIGSWTADQESIPSQGLIPVLREVLPG